MTGIRWSAMRRVAGGWGGLALALMLSACGGGGGGAEPATEPPQVTPGRWVLLGSSTALGAGATGQQGWAQQLAAELPALGASLSNLAVGGSTTYAARPSGDLPPAGRAAPDPAGNVDAALALAPRLLLLAYPGNDTALGLSADETVANLGRVRAHAQARGVAVLVLGTQPRQLSEAGLARLAEIDRRLARLAGECFVELRSGLAGPDGRLAADRDAGDGVHPNDAGHALILARVRARLRSGRCVRLGP